VTRLKRFSEPYQPTGSAAAGGVLNQLGHPDSEPMEVLVREAVQNCWDAHRSEGETVEVEIGARTVSSEQIGVLRERVLREPPPGLPLEPVLTAGLQLLHFADFGTRGLGGPTRAGEDTKGPTDFVDFVRNIGQPPDREFGGGSYGYGKAVFYLASRARTIIIDTVCAPENERRLIAYGLGDQYSDDGTLHTGRHWWGVIERGVPEPLRGEEAARLAAELGLPSRGPRDHGTTVAIIAPRLHVASQDEDLDLHSAMDFIAECLLWNFWPKLTAPPGESPAMAFRLSVEGDEWELEDPRRHPRLAPFAEAMDLLRDPSGATPGDPFSIRADLECRSPKKTVGTLALRQISTAAVQAEPPLTSGARATADGLHHIALMRKAELVVTYRPGPVLPVPQRGYAAVFRCHPDLDEVFRRSEPPTHDSWNPTTLSDPGERRFVNASFRRIEEELRDLVGTGTAGAGVGAGIAVGRFADGLAGLLGAVGGPGARRVPRPQPGEGGSSGNGPGPGGGGGAASGPQIVQVNEPELRVDEGTGEVAILTPFMLDTDGVDTRLRARVEVLTMDGGQVESEPPIGATVPAVLRWTDPAGATLAGEMVKADHTTDGRWEVWVEHQPDLMVRIAIEAEVVEA
jgi:hypothetical protein